MVRFLPVAVSARTGLALTLAGCAFALYAYLSWLQWERFFFPSWDLAIFSAAISQYAQGDAPIVWIKGDHYHLLGDHFHPLLVVLAPVWWVWPSPLALLWVQAALFALSSVPLTLAAMRRLGTPLGAIAGALYVFSFGIQGSHSVQFHEYALAVPLLACAVVAALEGRTYAAVAWSAPLVFVKEDLGLTVAVFGCVLAWMHRDRDREAALPQRIPYGPPTLTRSYVRSLPRAVHPAGVGLAVWGLTWFVLATFVIVPALSPQGGYEYANHFGSLTGLFAPADKWVTLAMFVAFMGVTGVKSPLAYVLVPTLAWRMAGGVEHYWGWQWHYNSILMPIAFGALLHVLPDIRAGARRLAALGACALSTAWLGASLPVAALASGADDDASFAHSARQAVAAVPHGASVAADLDLLAPLVPHASVQWVHGDTRRAPQCVAVRVEGQWSPWAREGLATWASSTWRQSSTPVMVDSGGGRVQVSAHHPYRLVYSDAWFEVACQHP